MLNMTFSGTQRRQRFLKESLVWISVLMSISLQARILFNKYCLLLTGIAYTLSCKKPLRKKSSGLRCGERPSRPSYWTTSANPPFSVIFVQLFSNLVSIKCRAAIQLYPCILFFIEWNCITRHVYVISFSKCSGCQPVW